MTKFAKGDLVIISRSHSEGAVGLVENWRGGNVAPYVVRILKATSNFYKVGEITYLSGRDMEHQDMQGKKKIHCIHQGCSSYSFEDQGVLQWQCSKHYPCELTVPTRMPRISTDDKVNLILEHLGLEVSIKPASISLEKIDPNKPKDNNGS